jgi:phosphatidylethanolamine-binding protein (PEBP) family uncharacterized protein
MMHLTKLPRSVVTVLGLAVALVGLDCTSSDGGAGGTGGSPGTGGQSSGTGGSGTGGTPATGGVTGTGGTATGGITGTGGTATGGITGTGGTATGGITGTGGAAGGAGHPGGGSSGGGSKGTGGSAGTSGGGGSSGSNFSLTSNAQADGAHFASKYTCQESPPLSGKSVGGLANGINPDLEWMNAPAGTMSFAITFLDTTLIDAHMDSLGNHWAIWNIPATTTSLPEGLTGTLSGGLANAKQSGTFLAPCAQSLMNNMDDKYAFTVYALSVPTITASTVANARTALMTAMTAGQVLGTAVLTGHAGLKGM